ncbi:hypothetical protein ABPG72_002265 [Tetrahymena utriculariae]
MGNQNIQVFDKRNILFVGSDCLEDKYLLDKFFNNYSYKIESIGNVENIKITMIQRKNENECAVWLLRYNDINFTNTINVLIKTVKISGLVICLFEEDEHMIQEFKTFLKQYTCEEYLRGISLGVLVVDEENPFKNGEIRKEDTASGDQSQNQENLINLYMRQLKIEKDLHLRDLDPRIIKQIYIINVIQTNKLGDKVSEFLEKVLDATSIL